MEHTKKFVLTDPRFVRPSMRDKTLSGLDADISNILDSDASDEIKAKNYAATLSRFKHIYNPPQEKSKTFAKPKTQVEPTMHKKLRDKVQRLQDLLKRKTRFDDGGPLKPKHVNLIHSDISDLTVDEASDSEGNPDWD